MNTTLIIAIVAAVLIIGLVIAWIVSAGKARAELIRKDAQLHTVESLRISDRE